MKKAFTCRKSILIAFLSILMVCCSLLTSCEFLKGFFDRDAYWDWRINKMEFAASSQGEDYYILYQGKTISIAVETDKSLYEEVRYWSDDESIVSFVKGGDKEPYHQSDWQGVSLGSTKIYAEAVKSKVRAEITVTVVEAPIPPRTEFLGSGTEDDPYRIEEKQDLLLLQSKVNVNANISTHFFTEKYFKLTNDIKFNDYEWSESIKYFDGIFDGNGYKIDLGNTSDGLFWVLEETSIVNNLLLEIYNETNPNIVETKDGYSYEKYTIASMNLGKIENCKVTGAVTIQNRDSYHPKDWFAIGGLVVRNNGIIANCISDVDIKIDGFTNQPNESTDEIGGLATLQGWGALSRCVFLGSIKYKVNIPIKTNYIAALIGYTTLSQSDLYYDIISLDGRTEDESDYVIPAISIGCGVLEGPSHTNVGGVSDWSTVDFSSWDHEIWDFSGETPELRLFKK